MNLTADAAIAASEAVTQTAPKPLPLPSSERAASLVIQTSFLGDMVLTTPLIAELAARGPVDVVATPASAPLLANNPSIRTLIPYDKRGDDRGLFGLWRAGRTLAHDPHPHGAGEPPGNIRAAYLAQGSMRSAMLAVLAGIEERVGFATSAGRPLYTRVVPYREELHHAERLWQLAAPPFAERALPEQIRPRLFPGDAEISAVDALLRAAGHAGERLIALAPGSVWATKRWPYYPELARLLAPLGRIMVVGGAADAPLAAEIQAAVPGLQLIDATGRLSLLASAELLGRAAALVTNDSAPQHLASAMGTPTITIFGPTVAEFGFGPLAPRNATVGNTELDCRPCDRHGPRRCPLGHWRCMREVTAESVAGLVARVSSNAEH